MQTETIKGQLIGIYFLESLTWTERDVFYSMTEGYSYNEISKLLDIKESTVKKHRENICGKLRNVLEGECTCKKASRVGLSWWRFGLKTGILNGQKWLERAKEAPFCRS